ncbi:MAG: EamA family transporter [Kiritimatiellales bacterium]
MFYLLIVSLIWAFSFGLIKDGLAGIPAAVVALTRLSIALFIFLPFLRARTLKVSASIKLMITGAVQYGFMYVAYIHAFNYLQAYEIALFTVFTPLYVTLLNDAFKKQFCIRTLTAVLLAITGGAIIEYRQLSSPELWRGFAFMQVSNFCFAFGQIFYRRTMERLIVPHSDLQVFALLYCGAVFATVLTAAGIEWSTISITPQQIRVLLYLGAIASGFGFFLWNIGARRVRAGTLAIFNNLKIPFGILVSIFFFGEAADWPRLLAGGALMGFALIINCRKN